MTIVLEEWTSYEPEYMETYEFEKIDLNWWRRWIANNFWVSLLIGGLYLVMIVLGQILMKNRKPFNIKKSLITWNMGLALFSLFAAVRSLPEFYHNLTHNGFHSTLCKRNKEMSYATGFWAIAFLFSKIFELFDTLFIILRKKPVIFLHWYHHLTVLTCSFFFFPNYDTWATWGALINASIHFFMYTYYALMTAGFKIRRDIAMTITVGQMVQFAYTVSVVLYILVYKKSGGQCDADYRSLYTALCVISSYFILFGIFFKSSYLKKVN